MNPRRSVLAFILLALMLVMTASSPLQSQATPPAQQATRGSITGIVRDAQSNAPLALVNVVIAGTSLGAQTGTDGRYNITNVTPGIVTLSVTRIAYSPQTIQDLRVTAGAPTVKDILLSQRALILTAIVSTGVSDPTSGTRAPFSVTKVGSEQLQVPSLGSPLETLAGKVAGMSVITGSGAPGSDVIIQIRNPLSLRGNTQPLIIIDGVIQMQDDPSIDARSIAGNPLDIDPNLVESIEIVRGAAAAALYGQRAANGVINITTKRGTDIGIGTTRFTLGTDAGFQQLGSYFPQIKVHRFLVDENNVFIDSFGRPILDRQYVNDPDQIYDNPWGIPTYDNASTLFKTGYQINASLNLAQSTLGTNFSVSGASRQETGVVKTPNGGINSQNLSIALDHRAGEKLSAGLGLSYNRQFQRFIANGSDIYENALEMTPDINMAAIDPTTGDYIPFPDSRNNNALNPLFFEPKQDRWEKRIGAQANAQATFRPTSILSLQFSGGYSRQDRENQLQWQRLGALDIDDDEDDNLDIGEASYGQYDIGADMNEAFNTRAGINLLTGFGGMTVRGNISATSTMDRRHGWSVFGDSLVVSAPDIDFTRRQDAQENKRDSRTLGVSTSVAFDYNQKYIADLVFRREGNSLLPPVNRWRGNGRASAAWLMSEESWFPLPDLTLFKPRYSIGTAGNNPIFDAQYETYLQNPNTERIFKQNMGNNEILPEEVLEQEFGLDLAFRNKYSLSLTYVRNTVKNVIRPDTIVAYTGFDVQESNLGDLAGTSYEATVESQWVNTRAFRWSSTLVLGRSRQKITSYPRRCAGANTTTTLERECVGFIFGQMFGSRHITSKSDLNPRHVTSGAVGWNFDINDDGLVVAVDSGGSWTDMGWGRTVPIDGLNYAWGIPIRAGAFDSLNNRSNLTAVIGQGLPDVDFGFGNQFLLGRWSAHIQMVGQLGGKIFNRDAMSRINDGRHQMLDQSAKPVYAKKPITYYTTGSTTSTGTAGLTVGGTSAVEWFLEDGDYLKISELRVAYRLDGGLPVLRRLGMSGGSVALVARNLFTFDSYSGIDPQVSGGSGATTARVDETNYPRFRTISASIRLTF